MAAKRASIAKSSGQGLSRGAYKLGNKLGKEANAPKLDRLNAGNMPTNNAAGREYRKPKGGTGSATKASIPGYGEFAPSDIDDLKKIASDKPPKAFQ